MNFNSLAFLVFLPVVLILYSLTPKKFRYIVLLAASYFFYMQWNVWLGFLMLAVTAAAYISAILIERTSSAALRKTLLAFTLILCFGVLLVFKYLNFILSGIVGAINIFGGKAEYSPLNIILPVGISFYTFQSLSYVIDVYRRDIKAEKHFGYFALFVSFFPQLVAGPIERPENLLPQLKACPDATQSDLRTGAKYMISGFIKKVAIADLCALIVNPVYESYAERSGFALIVATILFAIQIYCDFSGYSEIALGCASLMGIKLMKNFDSPYLATDIRDFWRRWHISLTKWFTDYLYIPLGGSRKGRLRTYINTFIVFMVSGLWHGANLTFVAWGCIHGIYLIISRAISPLKKKIKELLKTDGKPLYRAVSVAATFFLVCFAWIFFRSESISAAWTITVKIFCGPFDFSDMLAADIPPLLFAYIPIAIAILAVIRKLPQPHGALYMACRKAVSYNVSVATLYFVAVVFIAVSWASLSSLNGVSQFIYFQF